MIILHIQPDFISLNRMLLAGEITQFWDGSPMGASEEKWLPIPDIKGGTLPDKWGTMTREYTREVPTKIGDIRKDQSATQLACFYFEGEMMHKARILEAEVVVWSQMPTVLWGGGEKHFSKWYTVFASLIFLKGL